MIIKALKTLRCGEPPAGSAEPTKAIAEMMVRLLGGGKPAPGASKPIKDRPPCPRIIKGNIYPTFPVELGKALVKAGAAEEVDRAGNAISRPKKAKAKGKR